MNAKPASKPAPAPVNVTVEEEINIGGKRFKDDESCYRYISAETNKRDAINADLRAVAPVMFARVARGVVNSRFTDTVRETFRRFMTATHAKKFSEAQVKFLSGLTDIPAEDLASIRF